MLKHLLIVFGCILILPPLSAAENQVNQGPAVKVTLLQNNENIISYISDN